MIINSKLHFFSIFRENFTITYTRTFLETAYVWKERQFFVVGNKLSLAIFRYLIQASVSNKKSYKS